MDYFHAHISRKLEYPSLLFFGRFRGSDLTDFLMYQGRAAPEKKIGWGE